MNTYRIRLTPKSIIEKFPSSETIFGAICWGIHHLYNDIDLQEKLAKFDEWDKRFIISSSFPLLKSRDKDICCYPKPILAEPDVKALENIAKDNITLNITKSPVKIEDEDLKFQYSKRVEFSRYKEFHNIEYLSESLFQRLVNCGSYEDNINIYKDYVNSRLLAISDKILLTKDEYNNINNNQLIISRVTARNKIDRISFATVPGGEIYYQQEMYLNPNVCELYFLLMTEDIEFFKPIFRWLEDTGIGGNRTVGRGFYKITIQGEVNLPNDKNAKTFLALAKFLPKENEIEWQSDNNFYDLLVYQPRLDTMFFKGGQFIKDSVTYIKEGSVLEAKERKSYYGMLRPSIEIQKQKIYQYGLTIPIFIKLGDNANETKN
ncbi:MAG: RAMP superfamily CRISPR-associated protein [candidate division WOR-3 bacterium]